MTWIKIKAIKTLAIVAFSCVGLVACGEPEEAQKNTNPDAYIKQGQAYLAMHQYKAAFSAANDAIKISPDKLESYLILAEIHQQSGRPQESIKSLEKFTGVKNAEYYFALIDAYQQSQKLLSAQHLIEQQQQILSTQAQRLQFVEAEQLLYSNQFSEAQDAFTTLLNNPEYKIPSMLALAKIEAFSNNITASNKWLDEIIELDVKNTDALYLKSMLYIKVGDLNNAEKYLSDTLTTLPSSDIFTNQRIQIIQNLSAVLTQQGRSAEAMVYSRILSDEFPGAESLSMQYNRALELFEKQDFLAAKKILEEIQSSHPAHKQASTLLSLILYSEGDLKRAEELLSEVVDPETSSEKLTELLVTTQLQQNKSAAVLNLLDNTPEENRNSDMWVLYGSAAIQERDFTKALTALKKAQELDAKSINVALYENYYYNNLAEPQSEKGLQAISSALSIHPEAVKLQIAYIKQLLKLDKKAEADNYVTDLTQKYSSNSQTQLVVAHYYLAEQKLDQAKEVLEKILLFEEDNLQALYGIARVNELQQYWQINLTNYKKIIGYYPLEINAYHDLVITLLRLQKDPLQAKAYLPDNYQPNLLALALAYLTLQQNKLELAKHYALEAENGLPNKYQVNLASLTLQIKLIEAQTAFTTGDYPTARKMVIEALVQNPKDIRLLSLLTYTEIQSKEYNEAKKIIDQIATLLPNAPLSTLLASELQVAQGNSEKATELLQTYWQKHKDDQVADKIYQQLRLKNPATAELFLDEWLDDSPDSIMALRYKALQLQMHNKTTQALVFYEKVLSKTTNDITSLNNAAWLYFEQNDPKALSLAEKAYKLAPNNGAILDTYGWILFNTKDKASGKKLIEQASKLLPDDVSIKEHLSAINQE